MSVVQTSYDRKDPLSGFEFRFHLADPYHLDRPGYITVWRDGKEVARWSNESEVRAWLLGVQYGRANPADG